MSFSPSPMQALILFRLVFTGEEPKISDLSQLKPKARRELVDAGFIELEKCGRAQHILLTDRAWAWVEKNLVTRFNRNAKPHEAFEGLLQRLHNYLEARDLALVEFLQSTKPEPAEAEDIYSQIREGYMRLSGGHRNVRVRLKDLRSMLSGVAREQLDAALLDLQKQGRLVLMHLDDPQERTYEDEQAAIEILGNKRHILYMEG